MRITPGADLSEASKKLRRSVIPTELLFVRFSVVVVGADCQCISPAFHDTIISDSAREFVHDFTLLYRIPSYTVVGEGIWEVWIKVFIPTEQIIPHISSRVRASSMIISVFSTVSSYHIFQVLSFRYFLNSAAPAPHHPPLFP